MLVPVCFSLISPGRDHDLTTGLHPLVPGSVVPSGQSFGENEMMPLSLSFFGLIDLQMPCHQNVCMYIIVQTKVAILCNNSIDHDVHIIRLG